MDAEVNRRLEMMAFRLQDLVIEGQAALCSQVHVIDVNDDVKVRRTKGGIAEKKKPVSGIGLHSWQSGTAARDREEV